MDFCASPLGNPATPTYTAVRKGAENVAQKAGLSLVTIEARDPQEIENAFAAFGKERVQAFIAAGIPIKEGLQKRRS